MNALIGIGLYTPAEAGRLLELPAATVSRWLRGHTANGRRYAPLWKSQVDLEDGHTYLGFRDLMEARVAAAFISHGVSPQRVRAAITLAREVYGKDHPLSTNRFRTDGKDIFLRVIESAEDGDERERLLNTFQKQYAFAEVIEPSFKHVEFDDQGSPLIWWPRGRKGQILVDPARAFGQPIDAVSSVPTSVLAAAGRAEGVARAARAFDVPPPSIRRAMEFEDALEARSAA
ncbi:hypothetical protein [Azorhizobium doebereinerae]|uniref:hypothetical protein n=1 Tax=Azorhizobium doebereinerae TaxID=281091 RepID=UPI0004027EC8|nr:hypothetical protein [Azorhizobium doebereinerae]